MSPDHLATLPPATSHHSPHEDKFLLVKGMSGLGNRILCALGGILYARLSGRRLVIDWSDPLYSSNGDNVFHRFFQCPASVPTDDIPVTDSVTPAIWRGRLHDPARRIVSENQFNPDDVRRELTIDLGKLDYRDDVLVMVEYDAQLVKLRSHLDKAFQDLAQMPNEAVLAKMLREDLVPRPEIRERVDNFKRGRFDVPTVGVHIRYSDYRVRIFAIIRKLNALLKRERNFRVFLATDNIEIEKMFERNYPGLLTTPHWYGEPGRPIHTNAASPNCTEMAIEALTDLYLLAECDHFIFDASSSFAQVASLCSSVSPQNKIDVSTGDHGKGNRRVRGTTTRLLRRMRFSSWAFRLLPKVVPLRKL